MTTGAGAASWYAIVLVLAIAGCEPGATTTLAAPATASPEPVPSAAAARGDRPPGARLLGGEPGDPGAPGAEGSFTWGGLGSDAPWVVPGEAIAGTGSWAVAFEPPLAAQRWTADWAPVQAGEAGDPVARTTGAGPAIGVGPPPGPGRWSLRVEAWFGADRHASWTWTVDVQP